MAASENLDLLDKVKLLKKAYYRLTWKHSEGRMSFIVWSSNNSDIRQESGLVADDDDGEADELHAVIDMENHFDKERRNLDKRICALLHCDRYAWRTVEGHLKALRKELKQQKEQLICCQLLGYPEVFSVERVVRESLINDYSDQIEKYSKRLARSGLDDCQPKGPIHGASK
jgi:hypothetical protein